MKTLDSFDFNAWLKTAEPGEPSVPIAKKHSGLSDIKKALRYFKVPWKKRPAKDIARDLWAALKNPDMSLPWNRDQGMYALGIKAAKYYENRALPTNGTKLPYREDRVPRVTFSHRINKRRVVTFVVRLVDGIVSYRDEGHLGGPWSSAMDALKKGSSYDPTFKRRLRKAVKELDAQYKCMG